VKSAHREDFPKKLRGQTERNSFPALSRSPKIQKEEAPQSTQDFSAIGFENDPPNEWDADGWDKDEWGGDSKEQFSGPGEFGSPKEEEREEWEKDPTEDDWGEDTWEKDSKEKYPVQDPKKLSPGEAKKFDARQKGQNSYQSPGASFNPDSQHPTFSTDQPSAKMKGGKTKKEMIQGTPEPKHSLAPQVEPQGWEDEGWDQDAADDWKDSLNQVPEPVSLDLPTPKSQSPLTLKPKRSAEPSLSSSLSPVDQSSPSSPPAANPSDDPFVLEEEVSHNNYFQNANQLIALFQFCNQSLEQPENNSFVNRRKLKAKSQKPKLKRNPFCPPKKPRSHKRSPNMT